MSQYPVSNKSNTTDRDAFLPTHTVGSHLAALGVDEDAALVRRSQKGESNAFRELVARHDKRVYTLVARVLGPSAAADDVDDVAQDVFVQAWRALPKFRSDAKFSTWLYRIATNMAIKQWHQRKKQSGTVYEAELPETVRAALADPSRGPAEEAVLLARDRGLRQAIEALPEKQRTVVLLHYFEEQTCEEVALLLGCSVGTVWSRLHYACRKLRESAGWLEEK